MGATLKIRITDLVDDIQPYFGWIYTDGLGQYITVKFFFVQLRGAPFEATILPNLNQALKDAIDIDLVPGGEYQTSIDANYLYVESLVIGRSFSFTSSSRMVYTGEVLNLDPITIVITEALPSGALLNAYNENVIRFTLEEKTKVNLEANNQLPVTLYPDPTGEYHLNFKDFSTTLINANSFKDEVLPDIEVLGYSYSDLSMFLELVLKLSEQEFIQTATFYFLKSVGQIANYSEKNIADNYILLPFDGVNHKVTYYEGYPFDIPIFSNANQEITIVNKTTGHSVAMNVQKYTNRLFFSQGSENFTIDDVMPMQSGMNRLELQFGPLSKIDLVVNKVPSKCAPYFKFYRNSGGFGYIRFEKEVSEELKTKEGLRLRTDFDGIQNTIRRSITDKATSVKIDFQTEALEPWEMENFKEFIGSPRVEMYVSDLFQRQTDKSWIGVDVTSSTLKSKKLKTSRNREVVTVEFDLYNLHL